MIDTGEKGFSLVEVLVASAIFTFGMLAILGMLVTAMGGNAQGRQTTEATNLAVSKIEDLKLTPYYLLQSGSDTTAVTNSSLQDTFTRTWTVYTSVAPPMNLKRVLVTTSWTAKGKPHSVTIQTLVPKQ
jgi:prepilin-type N-terminal cleavage/methylation domain-containing protein